MAAAKTVRIKNLHTATIVLPPVKRTHDRKAMPGRALDPQVVTVLAGEYWEAIADRSDVRHLLDVKLIAPASDEDVAASSRPRDTLGDLSEAAALEHVGAARDVDTLMAWVAAETRSPVKQAIMARIEILENAAKKAAVPAVAPAPAEKAQSTKATKG